MTIDRISFCLRCVRAALVTVCACKSFQLQVSDNEAGAATCIQAALVTVCACKSFQLQVSDNEAGAATCILISRRLQDFQPYGTYNRVLPGETGRGSFSSRCCCSPITLRQHDCYLIYISGHNWRCITAACFPSGVRIPDPRQKAVRNKEMHWSNTNIGVLSSWSRDGFLLRFSLCKLWCWMVCYWGVSIGYFLLFKIIIIMGTYNKMSDSFAQFCADMSGAVDRGFASHKYSQ